MPRFTMPLLDVKNMALALLPHVSRDQVTPVMTHVALGGDNGQFAYATDRYTIGRYDLTNIVDDLPDEEMLIPWQTLAAIRSLGKAVLPFEQHQYTVEFEKFTSATGISYVQVLVMWNVETGDETLSDCHYVRMWQVSKSYGNFPAVRKFFADFLPGKVERIALGGDHLGKFTGYAKAYGADAMRITLADTSDGRSRLAPHLIEIGPRFKGLIQPYTLFDTQDPRYGRDLAADNKKADEERRKAAEAGEAEGQKK